MSKRSREKLSRCEKLRRKLEGVSVKCPVCGIRVPAYKCKSHLKSAHPGASVDATQLKQTGVPLRSSARTNTMQDVTNTNGKKTRPFGRPIFGGSFGLGRSRKN